MHCCYLDFIFLLEDKINDIYSEAFEEQASYTDLQIHLKQFCCSLAVPLSVIL